MKNNTLIKYNDDIYRILDTTDTRAFIINCKKKLYPDGFILISYRVFFLVLMMKFSLSEI